MLQFAEIGRCVGKAEYEANVPGLRKALIETQYDLSHTRKFATVVLFAGVKTAGKSETVNQLLAWLDPRFVETHSIGLEETDEQRLRPFMWRFWQMLPPKGRIAIFFEHWYTLPVLHRVRGQASESEFGNRLAEIDRFERMLTSEGVLLLKFHLHISRKEQRKRLKELTADPLTRWRVTKMDRDAVKYGRAASKVVEQTFRLTSHGLAPWVVVEAKNRRYRELAVAQTLHQAIRRRLDEPAVVPAPRNTTAEIRAVPDNKSILAFLDYKKSVPERTYARDLGALQARLSRLTRADRLERKAVILAFEGTDAAGKGGTIRRVVQAIEPAHYRVIPIAKPTDEEAAHPYLWRFWRHIPRRGHVAIFDRSWYGRVLVERVEAFCPEADWRRAYGEINDFETQLVREGVILVKFWLAISADEQLRRFKERQRQPFKHFKITEEDWRNRDRWGDYEQAVSDMVALTSTDVARWTLVEAEDKAYARINVLRTLCERIEAAL